MIWSQRWWRSTRFGGSGGHKPRRSPQARLFVEGLETRLMPASVFVVPVSQLADATHLHTLADAITAAGSNGMVTIEPGASPDPTQPVNVATGQNGLTIQGDPSVPASILPQEQLTVAASGITLTNLNLGSLSLGGLTSSGDTVSKCLIVNLSESASNSSFTQNTITGSAVVQPLALIFHSNGNVLIANNTFSSAAPNILQIPSGTGVTVTGNTFSGGASNSSMILVTDAGSSTGPLTISNNTVAATDAIGINIVEDRSGTAFVRILNNTISTNNVGFGLFMNVAIGDVDHFNAMVQGNDFHNNRIGIEISGDGTGAGNIDLGGGTLSSLGGNDFRGFSGSIGAAVQIVNASSGVGVAVAQNIFTSGVDPSTVLTGGIFAFTDQTLSNGRAFVQTLYNQLLGRTGALTELDPWVQLLNSQGQAAVSNAILHSPEALGRIVDSFYLRFLGRQSDAAGRAGFISFLQNGGTEEQVETLFLTSPEYISHIDTDFVQSLYLNILGRPGSLGELAGWNNNIQNLGGLAGVANDFVHSPENRLNTLRADFQTFLHRTPADSEISALANSTQDLLSLEGLVLSSPEFFVNG
jgi:hypothetical protein